MSLSLVSDRLDLSLEAVFAFAIYSALADRQRAREQTGARNGRRKTPMEGGKQHVSGRTSVAMHPTLYTHQNQQLATHAADAGVALANV